MKASDVFIVSKKPIHFNSLPLLCFRRHNVRLYRRLRGSSVGNIEDKIGSARLHGMRHDRIALGTKDVGDDLPDAAGTPSDKDSLHSTFPS